MENFLHGIDFKHFSYPFGSYDDADCSSDDLSDSYSDGFTHPDEINNNCSDASSGKADHVKRIVDNTGRKRRIYSNIHNDPKQSSRRFRANDRERRRMNSLNGALQALKGCVPSYHGKKRLTKLQILKFACHYISDLSDILCTSSNGGGGGGNQDTPSPTNSNADIAHSYDTFMSMMAAEQHEELMETHQASNMQPNMVSPNNINGLSMMQRLDYLTFHSYFNNESEAMNINLSDMQEQQNHSDIYATNHSLANAAIPPEAHYYH